MDNSSATPPSDGFLREGIWYEVDAVDENCDYSSQRHFNARTLCEIEHYSLGVGAILLAAIAAATLLYPPVFSIWLSAVSAIGSAIMTGTSTLLKPTERFISHADAGEAYLALRNDARAFKRLSFRDPRENVASLRSQAQNLTRRMNDLNATYSKFPTSPSAYMKAKKDIHKGHTKNRADIR